MRDLRRAVAFEDATTCGLRAPILFDDAPNVTGAWMKFYRFGLPATQLGSLRRCPDWSRERLQLRQRVRARPRTGRGC